LRHLGNAAIHRPRGGRTGGRPRPRSLERLVAVERGLAQVYGFTNLDGSAPDCWRYMVEVQYAGKPADTTGYR